MRGHRDELHLEEQRREKISIALRQSWATGPRHGGWHHLPEAKERIGRASSARRRKWASPRDGHLMRTHGIDEQTYEAMLSLQGGVCRLCGRSSKKQHLHVDHDHKTGMIRGLLCFPCNRALGHLEKIGLKKICEYLVEGCETFNDV